MVFSSSDLSSLVINQIKQPSKWQSTSILPFAELIFPEGNPHDGPGTAPHDFDFVFDSSTNCEEILGRLYFTYFSS